MSISLNGRNLDLVYFDSTEEEYRRSKDKVLLCHDEDEPSPDTEKSRYRRQNDLALGKGATFSPTIFPGLYGETHPKPSFPGWEQWNQKNEQAKEKEKQKYLSKKGRLNQGDHLDAKPSAKKQKN